MSPWQSRDSNSGLSDLQLSDQEASTSVLHRWSLCQILEVLTRMKHLQSGKLMPRAGVAAACMPVARNIVPSGNVFFFLKKDTCPVKEGKGLNPVIASCNAAADQIAK